MEVGKTKLGLVGCGNIGTIIARAVAGGRLEVHVRALFDTDSRKALRVAEILGEPDISKKTFEEFLSADMDLVVEAASIEAVCDYGGRILSSGRDLLVLSVGALLDDEVRRGLVDASAAGASKIMVPSGAIGGLDLLKAAAVEGIDEMTLTTTKNPRSLPEVGSITTRKILFDGNARDAVRLFPRNINVAATLALASGAELRVKIVADPDVLTNTHEIRARGVFGEMDLKVSNLPSPDNPKTSYLAALSVIRSIQGVGETFLIGT